GVRQVAAMIAEAPEGGREVRRFVRDAGPDAARFHRFPELLAGNAKRRKWQEGREHVPAVAGFIPGVSRMRELARRVGAEALEVARNERAPLRVEFREPRK